MRLPICTFFVRLWNRDKKGTEPLRIKTTGAIPWNNETYFDMFHFWRFYRLYFDFLFYIVPDLHQYRVSNTKKLSYLTTSDQRASLGLFRQLLLYKWASAWQNQQNGYAPSEDSDQTEHPPSLIRSSLSAQWLAKDPSFLHADSKDSDQTGRMPRLIGVFAGRTRFIVSFVVRWIKWCYPEMPQWKCVAF